MCPLTAVTEDVSPTVSVFAPSRDSFSSSSPRTSKLICQATGFSPRQISVSWLQDGKRVESGVTTDKVEAEAKGPGPLTFKVTSSLTITESNWVNQNMFTCHVEHNGLSFQKNVSSTCSSSECSCPQAPGGDPQRRGVHPGPAAPQALASRRGPGQLGATCQERAWHPLQQDPGLS